MSSSTNPRIFLAGTSFRASYGGPAVSISRLAHAVSEMGLEVGLWAPDGTAKATPLLPSDSSVRTFCHGLKNAVQEFCLPDVLHDNGLWLPHNHALANLANRTGIARMVSTRGMLEPWALRHKRFKKRIAWHLYQGRDLRIANCLHATSTAEANNIAKFKLSVLVRTVPNGVDIPPEFPASKAMLRREQRDRIALFLGRIYPVKGLPMLIDAWGKVRPRGWKLHIAGPDEAGHRAEVERVILRNGLSDIVSFLGLVRGPELKNVYSSADLFVLPSHSESFGMSIAEALAHGLPVITTTAAPWPKLVERGCGWWVAPNDSDIAEALRQAASCDARTLEEMGSRGRAYVEQEFGWSAVAQAMVDLYRASCSAAQRA